jgi:ParB family chromosome partitioning protein
MAGLTEVPVVIRELDDRETMELALIENLQRENLSPIEEAKGYKTLMDTYGFTQEQVSSSVGKSRSAVANALRLLNLPPEIVAMVSDGSLSQGHARTLLGLNNKDNIVDIAKEIIEKDISVRQTEKLVKLYNNPPKEKAPASEPKSNFFKEVELALNENLGRKVSVNKKGEGGVLTVEFYSEEDLKDLANKLEER